MNKKLIALAVASACVAGEAMAQTANPVTLYGRVYLTFESVEAKGGTAPVVRRNRIIDQASFVGFRGTEDLGGGLKAFFQLETAFPPDQNNNAGPGVATVVNNGFANRNSAIGLQGDWGSILMGRWDTPMKVTQTAVDPWGDLTIGDITGAGLDQANFSRRESNSVQYWSPNWGGFTARLLYTANELKGVACGTGGSTLNASTTGASVAYSGGPLYVALAYEKHKDVACAGTGATANAASEDGMAIAARYTIGPVKLSAQFGKYERDNAPEDESFMLAIEWAFGKHVLIGSYQEAEAGTAECDMGSFGYRYDFSRRTFFVASYAKVNNKNGMNCNFGTAGIGAAGQNPQGIGLGVRHLF